MIKLRVTFSAVRPDLPKTIPFFIAFEKVDFGGDKQ